MLTLDRLDTINADLTGDVACDHPALVAFQVVPAARLPHGCTAIYVAAGDQPYPVVLLSSDLNDSEWATAVRREVAHRNEMRALDFPPPAEGTHQHTLRAVDPIRWLALQETTDDTLRTLAIMMLGGADGGLDVGDTGLPSLADTGSEAIREAVAAFLLAGHHPEVAR